MIQRRPREKKKRKRKNDGWLRDSLILGDDETGLEALANRREANPQLEFRIADWRKLKPDEGAEESTKWRDDPW